jgi:hypothetical protein
MTQQLLSPLPAVLPGQAKDLPVKAQVVHAAEMVIHLGMLCYHPGEGVHLLHFLGGIQAHHPALAGGGREQPGQQFDGGGLARPVGAQKAEHLALRQGEVQTADGFFAAGVGFAQLDGLYGLHMLPFRLCAWRNRTISDYSTGFANPQFELLI